jgi:hypothetical protein
LGARLAVTWFVISALIRIRVGINRGLVDGFEQAQRQASGGGEPRRGEAFARRSGRTAGRAVRAYRQSRRS